MINAGKLDQRITILQPPAATSLDAAGQPTGSWTTFAAELPAAVQHVSGGERIRGKQVHADATVLIEIRWLAGVTKQMKVQHGDEEYSIAWCGDPNGRRVLLRIEAKDNSQ